jgi:hypothetical protein
MEHENNMTEIASELKNATEEEITEVVQKWFEQTRTDGMKLGAKFIAAGVFGALQKHLNKQNPSLRDYERCMKDIRKIIAVQLTKQNETEEATKQEEEEV